MGTVRTVREHYYYADPPIGREDTVEINKQPTSQDNIFNLKVNKQEVRLFVDSGCKKTLIPRKMNSPNEGQIQPTRTRLRPYGTKTILPVQEVLATLESENGAQIKTTISVPEGNLVEPLLGDTDAKALNINKKGTQRKS